MADYYSERSVPSSAPWESSFCAFKKLAFRAAERLPISEHSLLERLVHKHVGNFYAGCLLGNLSRSAKLMNWYHLSFENRTAHVMLHDDIGCVGSSIGELIREIEKFNPSRIELQIDSAGGCSITGLDLAALFSRFETHALVSGRCYSAALFAALGAKILKLLPSARILLHAPAAYVLGNTETLLARAAELERLSVRIRFLLRQRTEASEATITKWLSADTYFTAAEAVAAGVADEVVDVQIPRTRVLPNVANGESIFPHTRSEAVFRTWLAAFPGITVVDRLAFLAQVQDWLDCNVKEKQKE